MTMNFLERYLNFIPWEIVYFGNSLFSYFFSFFFFLFFLLLFGLVQKIVLLRLKSVAKKTLTDVDDALVAIAETLTPPFYSFLALYVSLQYLILNEVVQQALDILFVVWIIYQIIIALQIFIDFVIEKRLSLESSKGKKSVFHLMGTLGKGLLWILGSLVVLSNIGINVTSLLAGLGIGGIAIAFALKNIIEDLFSSITIYSDKPFEVGDFIVAGESTGVVQYIGIKSTRIKALQGEEIVISNKELINITIKNFKKMEKRRVVFTFGITYETQTEKMREIPQIFSDIFSSLEDTTFDRAHFKNFDDSALIFEVVYFVMKSDYTAYMNIQQEVNYKIKEIFQEKGISMAYPTRTVYVKNGVNE
ncbi:MAG: mechanosensitive ion channel family protein [Candidatus Moranbacteria bacterium]|nr:mechanosensitive ion channel family protein [Candidatus Moranbacteria bacterium]